MRSCYNDEVLEKVNYSALIVKFSGGFALNNIFSLLQYSCLNIGIELCF